jgi:hypothetical protein
MQKQDWGLGLLTKQANIWAGAGRFDMAVLLLSEHIKEHAEDPEGYRELARIYDRPNYDGPDKRRAIVLYQRFVELARQVGGFSEFEIARAAERANALLNAPVEPAKSGVSLGAGVAFQCFYRGAIVCFSYGVATLDRLVLARAGEADPESGAYAMEVCGTKALRTTVYKFLRKKSALVDTEQELARLRRLTPEALAEDAACIATLRADMITEASLKRDRASGMWCLTVRSVQPHVLLFAEDAVFSAGQCHEILRRQIASRRSRGQKAAGRRQ